MRRRRRYFTAIGTGSFPLDMLRYDECWIASEPDTQSKDRGHRSVVLATDSPHVPTAGRWQSFGWSVSKTRDQP
jgi:hypothetical protein